MAKKKEIPLRAPAPENAWDRLPKESSPAFASFREYLLEGPERSIESVRRKVGKNARLLQRWSSENRWVARADAFDQLLARRQDDAVLAELEQRGRRVAELTADAIEALAAPGLELKRRLEKDPKLLAKIDVEELVRLAATSARAVPRVYTAERLARGQSTNNLAGPKGGPLEVEDRRSSADARAREMTDDALDNLLLGAQAQRRIDADKRKRRKAKRAPA